MAQNRITTVTVTDDLTGDEITEPTETTVIRVDDLRFIHPDGTKLTGAYLALDLSNESFAKFQEAILPFVTVAAIDDRPARKTSSAQKNDPELNKSIRAWAVRNDFKIAERGAIPVEVREAWAAHDNGARDRDLTAISTDDL